MKSIRSMVMATVLGVGLIPLDIGFIHATSAFTRHLETLGESYMTLVYLNLVIIVFLGSYALITLKNKSLVHPWEKYPQGKFDLNKVHARPVAQGSAVHVGQMIDATFVEIPGLCNFNFSSSSKVKRGDDERTSQTVRIVRPGASEDINEVSMIKRNRNNSLEKTTQIKTDITLAAWQEKSAQSELRQKDVDACWIRKNRENYNYSEPLSQGNSASSL